MPVDRMDTDSEHIRNLFARFPLFDKAEYLLFPFCQDMPAFVGQSDLHNFTGRVVDDAWRDARSRFPAWRQIITAQYQPYLPIGRQPDYLRAVVHEDIRIITAFNTDTACGLSLIHI